MHLNRGRSPLVQPPRGPRVKRGLLSTRSPHRPNPIALSAVGLERIEGRVLHEVRQALRELEWRTAARRRQGVRGIEDGIDTKATMALYALRRTTAEERGYIRSNLISGGE